MATQEERIAKILKLKEAAMHPGTPPIEAERYAAYAAKLIARHRITEDMLDAAHGRRRDIIERQFAVGDPFGLSKARMISHVAAAMHCRSVLMRHRFTREIAAVIVMGSPGDIERVEFLYPLLWRQAEYGVLTQPLVVSVETELSGLATRIATNWLTGFTATASKRLADVEAHEAAEVQRETRVWDAATGTYREGPSVALVLRDKARRVDEYYQGKYDNIPREDIPAASALALGTIEGAQAGNLADIGLRGVQR